MKIEQQYFETLLEEGSEEFELIFRSLFKEKHENLYALLDDTDAFNEPMVCSAFSTGITIPVEQMVSGFLDPVPSKIKAVSNKHGVVHVPKIGYFYTSEPNQNVEIRIKDDNSYGVFKSDEEVELVSFKEEVYINDTDIEICRSEDESIIQFFPDQTENIDLETGLEKSVLHLNNAFHLIRKHTPFYADWLNYSMRRIVLFTSSQLNSFASICTLNNAYVNLINEKVSDIFFLEEITHQCGHALFYPMSIDRDRLFIMDYTTPMSHFSGIETDDRDLINAFYSFFPQYSGNYIFDVILDHEENLDEDSRLELIGRYAFRMYKYGLGINQYQQYSDQILSEYGKEMFAIFCEGYEKLYEKRKELFDSLDIKDQVYVFDLDKFKSKNLQKAL
ncbi:hypothetical protein [Chryseobacterium sp. JK1]|uniref:hypothetical protein n=1 Tax=Chryseobacterium sp. JK1 TaxID=874294 RepID=UPI003D69EE2E